MEIDEALLTLPINPNNFPARLWCLVNNPQIRSIRWDSRGEAVIIDQQLFEAELLSPGLRASGKSPECFKTTNFTSFIRQLNLYGFRKLKPGDGISDKQIEGKPVMDIILHHFHNPDFKQGHPELLANLKRLTSINKARIEAGLEVTCRPPSRFHRFLLNSPECNTTAEKRGSVLARQVHQRQMSSSCYPHHSNASQQLKEYDRSPIPSSAWIMGHDSSSSSSAFYTDKDVPLYVLHHFPADMTYAVQSNPTSVNVQQGSQSSAAARSKFDTLMHPHPQYRSGFYSPASRCCPPGSSDADMACSHQAASYSHYGYYPTYAAGYLHSSGQNPDWLSGDSMSKKTDVNLDTVFKIVDELQGSPKVHMVKVSSPEKRPTISTPEKHLVGLSLHSSTASKPTSALASSHNDFPKVSRPIPVQSSPSFSSMGGIIITVPGNVSSGISITMGSHSSCSETGADEGLEQGSSQSEAALLESSLKVRNNHDDCHSLERCSH
ncbi:heat shock factor protein 5 [Colossoma macropomum]|uniref:heat shock factor protein 5 n=1 Tax=Colossoma macropomum TaxID=42526 RepID=UPI0018644E52|nr:heat shock factor protein 5 [Colossoma macropomum]